MLACSLRNGYGSYKEVVVLGDGATCIRNVVMELFPEAQQILDYVHLCENVNTYAKYLFKNDEKQYIPWAENICESLKLSKYDDVLEELKELGDRAPKDCPVNLYGYITNNINNIDYKTYIEKGYFIGSGAIESGHKLVLHQRLKQAGMSWNVPSAQPVLTLKTKSESALWESDVVDYFMEADLLAA